MSLKNRPLQLFLVVLSLVFGIQAQDRENCSDATHHGSYGLHATRTTPSGDFAAVGRVNFDGKGNLPGKLFVRVAGTAAETVNWVLNLNG
jgi:hypothetical protein